MGRLALGAVVTLAPAAARAELLPGRLHARDALLMAAPLGAGLGYGYGPRAFATLGLDLGVVGVAPGAAGWSTGLVTDLRLDNGRGGTPLPAQLLLGEAAWALVWRPRGSAAAPPRGDDADRGARPPPASDRARAGTEWTLALGRERAATVGPLPADAPLPEDTPFGGGGWFLALDGSAAGQAAGLTLQVQGGGRAFANLFPDLVGDGAASGYVASTLDEGGWLTGWLGGGARLPLLGGADGVLALHGDVRVPHDDSARTRWLGRAVLGVALEGTGGELMPYLAGEAGHGQGLLVNRDEARLQAGVRLVPR